MTQDFLEGLSSLLNNETSIEVVGEADNGRSAVEFAHTLKPDVVIMDISMPDLNGIEATRQIIANDSSVKIIALSVHTDKRYVTEMIKAGVSGYLLKECAFQELTNAIQSVVRGKIYLSPSIAGVVVDDYINKSATANTSIFLVLSKREREVLQLIAEGKSTKDIAASLYVSKKTVGTHRTHIMEKLHINNLADLIKYAIREGFTSLES